MIIKMFNINISCVPKSFAVEDLAGNMVFIIKRKICKLICMKHTCFKHTYIIAGILNVDPKHNSSRYFQKHNRLKPTHY